MSTNPLRTLDREDHLSQHNKVQQFPVVDLDLWQRLKLHDESAMGELYDRYSKLVFRVAHQVLRDPGTSDDVLQDVFLQLWRVPEAFDPAKGSLATWLTVVSRRRAIDWLRRRKGEVGIADLVIPINAKQLADAAMKQITNRVGVFLQEMPEELRLLFVLAYIHGLTHTEISERTGYPLGTTKTRIRLAMSLIRKKLDRDRSGGNGNDHV